MIRHPALYGALVLLISTVGAVAADPAASTALKTVDRIAIPDGPWDYASVDAKARRLYLGRGNGVMALDLDTGKLTPTLVPGARVHGVVALAGTNRILSTNGESNTATIAEADTGKVVAEIPTGQKPDAAVQDPKTGLVLVMNGKNGDVTVIDPVSAKAVGSIEIGGALEFAAADGGHAYVNIEDKNELAILDIASRKVTGRMALTGCEEPSGLALDPASGILLTVCSNNVALAIDSAKSTVIATLPIGKHPDAAIFDAARHLFLVPCGGDGTLTLISANGHTLTAAGSVPTERGARTGALDEKTGRIYLPTAELAPPASPGARPMPLPGSFHLLVVG
jgi:DNA-binding beta-propeller fold protein YncE